MKQLGKKAITVLMATLLLISFAVALGVVVMSLGQAQVEGGAVCPIEVGLAFSVISEKEQYCYNEAEKKLTFTIENGINTNVEGLVINVIGSEKAETFELNDAKMTRAGSYVGKVNFDKTVSGEIRQLKISPKLLLKGEENICPDQALVVESVGNC